MTITEAFKQFSKVQNRYARYGASDSEPDAVMQVCVVRALGMGSRPYKEPVTPEDWELYADMSGAEKAATALTAALRTLIAQLKEIKPDEEEMQEWCERVDF